MSKIWPSVVAVAVFLSDRVIKSIVQNGFDQTVGPVHIAHVRNEGLVFSWPVPYGVAVGLMIVAAVTIVVMTWYQRRTVSSTWPLWVLLAGALSNIYDRIFIGHIVDYVFLSRWWPVFNLADVAIAVGLVWWLFTARVDKQHRPSPK